jgi:HEAT repeat protein
MAGMDTMRRSGGLGLRRALLGVVLLAVLAAAAPGGEPTFAGATARQWLLRFVIDNQSGTQLAVEELSAGGMKALPVVLVLWEMRLEFVHADVLRTLRGMGSEVTRALVALVEGEAKPEGRQDIASLLVEVGGDGARAGAAHLLKVLGSGTLEQRRKAVKSLSRMEKGSPQCIPALRKAIHDEDLAISADAARALGCSSPDAAAIAELRGMLEGTSVKDQRTAALAFGRMGKAGACAIRRLVALARSNDPLLSKAVDEAIFGLGEDALPQLIEVLDEVEGHVHWAVLFVLQDLGPKAAPAIPVLARRLERDTDDVNGDFGVGNALAAIGPKSVPALVTALASSRAVVRGAAARALGNLGWVAASASGALAKLSGDPDPAVREAARTALQLVSPARNPVQKALIRLRTAKDFFERDRALADLTRVGRLDVSALIEALKEPKIRELVIGVLGKIGPSAVLAVPPLLQLSRQPGLTWSILRAFDGMGRAAVPPITKALADARPAIRAAAAKALGHLGSLAGSAIPALEKALSDESSMVRREAKEALAEIRNR